MDRLAALINLADRFHPSVLELVDERLYGGLRFFDNHKLNEDYDPGTVRLVLDIIVELRPKEPLLKDEQDLVAGSLDPRTSRTRKTSPRQRRTPPRQ